MSIETPFVSRDVVDKAPGKTTLSRYDMNRFGEAVVADFAFRDEETGEEVVFPQRFVFVNGEKIDRAKAAEDPESVFNKTPTDIRGTEIRGSNYYFQIDRFPEAPKGMNPLLADSVYLIEGIPADKEHGIDGRPSRLEFLHDEARTKFDKMMKDQRPERQARAREVRDYLAAVAIRRNSGVHFVEQVAEHLWEQANLPDVLDQLDRERTRIILSDTPANAAFAGMDAVFARFESVFGNTFVSNGDAELAARILPTYSWHSRMPDYRQIGKEVPVQFGKDQTPLGEGRILADLFLQRAAERGMTGMQDFLADTLKFKAIEHIILLDTIGLQGAGKGTLIKSMDMLAKQLSAEPIQGMSEAMEAVLFESLADNVDTIITGTKGRFNPKGAPRYQGQSLKSAAAIPVQAGILVNDAIVNLETTYEIAKSATVAPETKGKLMVRGETFPRSAGQARYYQETLPNYLYVASGGKVKFETALLHLEMVDEAGKFLLENNRELSSELAVGLGKMLEAMAPTLAGFDVGQRMTAGADKGEVGRQMLQELGTRLETDLAEKLDVLIAAQTDKEAAANIARTFINGMGKSLQRMAGRYKVEMRDDESKAASVLRRFGDYFKNSIPFVLEQGVEIIPALGTPHEAVEAYLKAKLRQYNPNYDFNSDEFGIVLAKVKEIHHNNVYPPVKQNEP